MSRVQTKILTQPWDVDRRLRELGLDRLKLLSVAARANAERSNATLYHALNAPGTFAYHTGVFGLRYEFVPMGWEVDREGNIESIRSEKDRLKVSFANVDLACNPIHSPKPRSEKRAGAERAASGNLFESLPAFSLNPTSKFALYYLMMDEEAVTELSRPVIKNDTFVTMIERIFLGNPNDPEAGEIGIDNGGTIDNFDPVVVRK